MTRRMLDKPTKPNRTPIETRAAIGRCPTCGTWIYTLGVDHECIRRNDGTIVVVR